MLVLCLVGDVFWSLNAARSSLSLNEKTKRGTCMKFRGIENAHFNFFRFEFCVFIDLANHVRFLGNRLFSNTNYKHVLEIAHYEGFDFVEDSESAKLEFSAKKR